MLFPSPVAAILNDRVSGAVAPNSTLLTFSDFSDHRFNVAVKGGIVAEIISIG